MPESLAVTVKFEAPAVVGVPEIAPALLRVNPAGKLPLVTLQVMVPTPPLDCKLALYGSADHAVRQGRGGDGQLGIDGDAECLVRGLLRRAGIGGCDGEIRDARRRGRAGNRARTAQGSTPPARLPVVTLQLMVPVPPEAARRRCRPYPPHRWRATLW